MYVSSVIKKLWWYNDCNFTLLVECGLWKKGVAKTWTFIIAAQRFSLSLWIIEMGKLLSPSVISKISLIPKSTDHSPIKWSIIYHLKDGEDQLQRSCERRSVTWITGGRKRRRKGGGRDERRKIIRKIKRRKVNWVGYTLRINCLQKQVIEVKMEGRQRKRRTQLLDENKEKTRTGNWKRKH